MESRIWSRNSRSSTAPQRWMSRSASVDFPWSMWAMMQKLRMWSMCPKPALPRPPNRQSSRRRAARTNRGESGLRRQLPHELVLPPLHILRRQVFLVGRDAPGVAERVGERAGAVAPELVPHLALGHDLPAGVDGALEQLVAVVDVQPERRRRS